MRLYRPEMTAQKNNQVLRNLAGNAKFIALFKDNSRKGIQLLVDSDQVPPRDAEVVSDMLFGVAGLDSVAVGDHLGGGKPFNAEVLRLHVDIFDFTGLGLDDALRKFSLHSGCPARRRRSSASSMP